MSEPKPTAVTSYVRTHTTALLLMTVTHNTAKNSSNNLPSKPPVNHHCS